MKKRIIIILSVISSLVIAFFGIQLYRFYNPEIEIGDATSESKTKEFIVVGFQEKSIFGMCDTKKQQLEDFKIVNNDLLNKVHEIEGVYYVNADVVFDGKGMKIMYEGATYINGEKDSFHFEEDVPFVLTKNLRFDGELVSADEAFGLYVNND